jgi:hypothetical protein
MLPSQSRLVRSFIFRTLIISALIASLIAAGCGTSYTAQPAPPQAPTITQQPTNQTVAAGGTATFTAAASGNPAPTVQWQVSTDNGTTFSNVSGAPSTSTTLTLTAVALSQSGNQYHAVFTNSVGSITSNAATLTVTLGPVISTNPSPQTVNAGSTASFTAAASGTPTPTVQWQVSTNGGAFTDITGETSTTLTLAAVTAAQNGNQYQAVFTNSAGIATTTAATLTVDFAPTISQQPMSQTVAVGGTATFTASASGNPAPTVQWQVSTDNGATFNNVTGVPSTSTTLTLTAVTLAQSGYEYHAVFTDTVGPATTTAATLTVVTGQAVVGTTVPFPVFSGGTGVNIIVNVTNDRSGDTLTATLTVDSNTGIACTTTICGTLPGGGLVAPATFVSLGNYTLSYTPPTRLSAQVVPSLVVTSSLSGSFASTDSIEVDPAGGPLVTLSGIGGGGIVQPNPATQTTLTATVYNDPGGLGVTFTPITANGYACANIAANSCGMLGTTSPPSSVSGVTTNTITYTPPAAVPSAPYDRPRIQATSVANSTQFASIAFRIGGNPASTTGLRIPVNQKFNSALATSTTPNSVTANFGNDTGNVRTITWKLTSGGTGGADCSGPCGTLSAATPTGNGLFVSSTINYTPPSTLPTVTADLTPTITATSVDNAAATDSFTFNIVDGTCPSAIGTTNGVLSGQYAFLLRGGSSGAGYTTLIGSFTANGSGGITGGVYDANRSTGGSSDVPIVSAGSSYSVGPDNRGCLYLNDAGGIPFVFRFSLGTLVGPVATEGRIIRFDDNNGHGPRQSGVLMKQNPADFSASAFNGRYAFGLEGVDSNGGRSAGAGIFTATPSTGGGALNNLSEDFDGVNGPTGILTGSVSSPSSYTLPSSAPSGRGTAKVVINLTGGGTSTSNSVIYMVSSSEILLMTTDALASNNPILSGVIKKRGLTFPTTSLDGNSYVFHMAGISNADGSNESTFGQFTVTTNGSATGFIDHNGNTEQQVTGSFTIDPTTGRMTAASTLGVHSIFYLVNSSLAFAVDTTNSVEFGLLEQQTGSPFSTASITGQYFFGADAPTTGSQYSSGTGTFTPSTGVITGTADSSRSDGLQPNNPISSGGTTPMPVTYCFYTSTCTPATTVTGQGNIGGSLAYIISPQKVIFMDTHTESNGTKNRRVFVIQQ